MQNEEDEEMETFSRKIASLKHVAVDLTEVIKSQNSKLNNLNPEFESSLHRLSATLSKVIKIDFKRFRGWMYYMFASLIFFVLLILLFFIL